MSNNTVNIARAISLLSDVLSREATHESDEDTEIDNDEYDDLKEQALEFGREVSDELSVISDDLERILDLDDEDDDDNSWNPLEDYDPPADEIVPLDDDDEVDEAEAGNGEVDISDTEADDFDNDDDKKDDDEPEPTADEKVQTLMDNGALLEKQIAELEKNKEELGNKIEDLTDAMRAAVTQIENLNAAADTFVSEVESL